LFRKEAMGMGDVKLFAFLGAWMGITSCVWILFLSALVGAVMGLSLLTAHKLVGRDEIETLTLPGQPTVKSRWLTAKSPIPCDPPEPTVPAEPAEPEDASPVEVQGEEDLVKLEFSRKTSRQLHHFPYGPYIAIAAVLVLLF